MSRINSRWRKGATRYSSERTIEDTHFVRHGNGHRRKTDTPTEVKWVERRRESFGWRNGARVRPSRRALPVDVREAAL